MLTIDDAWGPHNFRHTSRRARLAWESEDVQGMENGYLRADSDDRRTGARLPRRRELDRARARPEMVGADRRHRHSVAGSDYLANRPSRDPGRVSRWRRARAGGVRSDEHDQQGQ